MKTCNTCRQEKGLDAFYKRSDGYKDIYRSDCKECLANKAAKKYAADPEKFLSMGKRWRTLNPEQEKVRGKRRRKLNRIEENRRVREWTKQNPENVKLAQQRYRARFPEKLAYICALRKARLKKATPKWLSKKHKKQILAFYAAAQELSKKTGIPHHVDHMVPMAGREVMGFHVPWNLRVIPASENLRKSNLLILKKKRGNPP